MSQAAASTSLTGVLSKSVESIRIGLLSLPVGTRLIIAVCTVIQVFATGTGNGLAMVTCLQPMKVTHSYQIHRLWTHTMVHTGWLHLVLNMMTLVPFGPKVELHTGTVQFINVVLQFSFWGSIIYLALVFAIDAVGLDSSLDYACVIGFSGVLLGLLVVYVYKFSTNESIRVFGIIPVPNTLAPWACLVLLQFLPGVSFLGHLSGILIGLAYVSGLLDRMMFSPAGIERLKKKFPFKYLADMPGFVDPPPPSALHDTLPTTVQQGLGAAIVPSEGNPARFPGPGHVLKSTAERGLSLYEHSSTDGTPASTGDVSRTASNISAAVSDSASEASLDTHTS
eukprot:m.324283 g.324283  ORF g.324283 m.324283 type:complete len:338 (-) comp20371_c0_seq9:538-1551(-)